MFVASHDITPLTRSHHLLTIRYDCLIGGSCIAQISKCINVAKHGEIVCSNVFHDVIMKISETEIDTDVYKQLRLIPNLSSNGIDEEMYQVAYMRTIAYKDQKRSVRDNEHSLSSGLLSVASEYIDHDSEDFTGNHFLSRFLQSIMCVKRRVQVRPAQVKHAKFRLAELISDVSICEASVREQLRKHNGLTNMDSIALRSSKIENKFEESYEDALDDYNDDDDFEFAFARKTSSNTKKKNLERRASRKMNSDREAMVEILRHETKSMFENKRKTEKNIETSAQYRVVLRSNVSIYY